MSTTTVITLPGAPAALLQVHPQGEVRLISSAPDPQTLLAQTPPSFSTVQISAAPMVLLQGDAASAAGVFIQDITSAEGIVGQKRFEPGVPVLQSASADTDAVRVWLAAQGGAGGYRPQVSVSVTSGTPGYAPLPPLSVTLVESTSSPRWYTGSADVRLSPGQNRITAVASTGSAHSVEVERAGVGPRVLGVSLGPLPGLQTALKAGDRVALTVQTEPGAVAVRLLAGGASGAEVSAPVAAGYATLSLSASTATGTQSMHLLASNALGTEGEPFAASGPALDQTYPEVSGISVLYPTWQEAFDQGQSGTLAAAVSQADSVMYASDDLAIDLPGLYAPGKTFTVTRSGYVGSGSNISITATRTANAAVTLRSGLAKIATVPPSAAISINGNPARLVSSPAGTDYTVRLTPDQTLMQAPSLSAGIGTWLGDWVNAGAYWYRSLRITDSDAKGVCLFSGASLTGLSALVGGSISSSSYVAGGISQRTLTVPAFSRVVAIGCPVADASRCSCQIAGGAALARQTSSAVLVNGFYPANADASYNATGSYVGLSDAAFAASNTSGTLQVVFAESA